MRSGYNGALVQAVEYTGEATTLSWELQHSLCAAAGRATPGSDLSGSRDWLQGLSSAQRTEYQTQSCAYSPSDNHVVADECSWPNQEFTHVSGSLGGGVGYMCAGTSDDDCSVQVRVEGTTAASHYSDRDSHGYPDLTLNTGDAVFCSS